MAWGKAGSTTTASAGDSFDVTVSSNETNMLLRHITSSGNTVIYNRFNSDSGSNYAYRWSENGVTDGTGISQSSVIYDTGGDAGDKFDVGYICNISSEEKLVIGFQINEDISGAGNAPVRGEAVWKWSNTSDSVTSVNTLNTAQSGDYETGSNISVLGSDITPTVGKPTDVQAGSRYEETDTRKMYHYLPISTSELKAYYKFNEASGNIINQATSVGSTDSLSSEDLTVDVGTPSYRQTGVGNIPYSVSYGNTVKFSGTTASNWTFMNDQNDASVNVWIKSSELANGDTIMSTPNSSAANGFIFDYRSTGQLRFITEKANSPTGNTNWASSIDTNWHMITHVHDDSANTFQMYVDGSAVSAVHSATVPPANTPDFPLEIGDTSYSGGVTASIAEVSLWQRVLTTDEITALYNSGSGATVDNILSWKEEGT